MSSEKTLTRRPSVSEVMAPGLPIDLGRPDLHLGA
jgi:hypothetical protein